MASKLSSKCVKRSGIGRRVATGSRK